jgi:hypothetical protein
LHRGAKGKGCLELFEFEAELICGCPIIEVIVEVVAKLPYIEKLLECITVYQDLLRDWLGFPVFRLMESRHLLDQIVLNRILDPVFVNKVGVKAFEDFG